MIGIEILITFIKKVDMYENHHDDYAVECVVIAVRELCDVRYSDVSVIQIFSGSEHKLSSYSKTLKI